MDDLKFFIAKYGRENGTKKYAEKIRWSIISMTLRRGFNQDFNEYLNENPKEKQEWDRLNKILNDIKNGE